MTTDASQAAHVTSVTARRQSTQYQNQIGYLYRADASCSCGWSRSSHGQGGLRAAVAAADSHAASLAVTS